MANKNTELVKTTSCGALTWRFGPGGKCQVLLIKQFKHKENWGIPKGHTNEGESLEDCARREVREETGVEVILEERLYDIQIELKHELKTVATWIATPVNPDVEPRSDDPDSEVADVRWFNIDELPKIANYQQKLIADGIKKIKEPIDEHDRTIGFFK